MGSRIVVDWYCNKLSQVMVLFCPTGRNEIAGHLVVVLEPMDCLVLTEKLSLITMRDSVVRFTSFVYTTCSSRRIAAILEH